MSEYRLTRFGFIERLVDRAFIPVDPRNNDYIQYLEWFSSGNIPDPPILPASRIPSREDKLIEALKAKGFITDEDLG